VEQKEHQRPNYQHKEVLQLFQVFLLPVEVEEEVEHLALRSEELVVQVVEEDQILEQQAEQAILPQYLPHKVFLVEHQILELHLFLFGQELVVVEQLQQEQILQHQLQAELVVQEQQLLFQQVQ
jgi:hypothetical protein